MNLRNVLYISFLVYISFLTSCQNQPTDPVQTDTNTPLHALQPDYDIPYGPVETKDIKAVLDKVFNYLDQNTPPSLVNRQTNQPVQELTEPDTNITFSQGHFRLMSYEWGVTYAGMLAIGNITGDENYLKHTKERFDFLAKNRDVYKTMYDNGFVRHNPMRQVVAPHALDDAGAMCAAMIKSTRQQLNSNLSPLIETYIDYISNDEFRLDDGTLARNRPQPNTLWLDDLFMSVPALAQMGKYSGETRYFDDAVKQVLQFSERMFNWEKGLFMHGWVQGMEKHPEFYWARANGWAIMAIVELLDVLPTDHPGYDKVMEIMKAHMWGLTKYQSGQGFWHQLIDRNDSYLETSATAIYTYSMAKAINNGWIDAKVYGPVISLAWNAVATKVNNKGQVEGTCVGTGMAFDPAFYYYRPISVFAAHGYGPVLLAGAEMIKFYGTQEAGINDSAFQVYEK